LSISGDVGNVYLGPNHPMMPEFGLFTLILMSFVVFTFDLLPTTYAETHKAYPIELAQFHSADYVEFLHRITTEK
jgi:histone deacetylase 1/2